MWVAARTARRENCVNTGRAALALLVEVLQVSGQSAHGLVGVDVRGRGHELPARQAHHHQVEVVHIHDVDVLGGAAILRTKLPSQTKKIWYVSQTSFFQLKFSTRFTKSTGVVDLYLVLN